MMTQVYKQYIEIIEKWNITYIEKLQHYICYARFGQTLVYIYWFELNSSYFNFETDLETALQKLTKLETLLLPK